MTAGIKRQRDEATVFGHCNTTAGRLAVLNATHQRRDATAGRPTPVRRCTCRGYDVADPARRGCEVSRVRPGCDATQRLAATRQGVTWQQGAATMWGAMRRDSGQRSGATWAAMGNGESGLRRT